MTPVLAVATMLGGDGVTGVETHLNGILREAGARRIRNQLVTPYTGPRWVRAVVRPVKNVRHEVARVFYHSAQGWLLALQLRAVRRTARQPVVVYAQCPNSASAALRASRGSAAYRVVLVVHYNRAESEEVVAKGIARPGGVWCRHLDRVERETLPRVSKLIFVSDYMRRIVNARIPGISSVPQETIMNFPGSAAGGAVVEPAAGDIIAIGTLEPRKNQAFLLHVLAQARDRGARYSLALVGDGPDRARLERCSAELSLGDQVRFLGAQNDAARLIPNYRVLAHAARLENCPITLIEGLSCGRPLLAGAVGGIPEIFDDGVEGCHWDLNDPARAAEQLIALLESPRRYAAAAAAARDRYQRAFSHLPQRWLDSLVGQPAGAAAQACA